MSRVLIFGPSTRDMVEAVERAGHRVAYVCLDDDETKAIDAVCQAFDGRPADVLLTDLRLAADFLPVRHVRWLIREIWGKELYVPCLAMLTHRHIDLPDMQAHVDDFLLAPHSAAEATARLKLMLGRGRQMRDPHQLTFADLELDLGACTARDVRGKPVSLTHREFQLLQFLCTHRGKFFDRDRLLALVWGVEFEGSDRTVDIHICRLRNKLPTQAASLLETRRGVGYGFTVAS